MVSGNDMEDEEMTSSLTKGCFLFKPSSKNKSPRKKARRESTSIHACPVDYYSSIKQESKQDRSTRFVRYEECWNDLHAQIMEVQHNLNEKIFDDLLHFVISAHDVKKSSFPIAEIPTAALITGVNLPDHDVIFSSFVEKLKSSITLYAVRLFSKNCANLKSILKNALDGLVQSVEQEAEHYDEEVTLNISRAKGDKVFKDYSFKELRDWYKQTCLKVSMIIAMEEMDIETNNDSLSNTDGKVDGPPLVFVLEDFERFSPAVLQDFILIASEYVKELPILFVFGVATTVSAVHRFLPHAVSSRLSIEKFQSQPSLECLTEVIDKVLLSNEHAFKLGPMMFRLLYEHFLYHDFSVNNFIRALKYAVLDHFYENEFSILCTKNFEEIEDYIKSFSDAKLKRLQDLESFQKYLDRKSEKEQKKLKTDNTWLKKSIIELFDQLQNQEKLFFPVVKCFHSATANLPGHPYGKRLRDTYEIITVTNKNTYNNYRSAIDLLRFLSRDELKAILSKCAETLNTAMFHDSDCEVFKEHLEEIKNYVGKIEDLARGTGVPDNSSLQSPALRPKAPVTPAVFKSRYDFTEKLKSAVKEKRKESPYEILRNQIVEMLDKFFKKHLISPLSMPFHEIFYYDDMDHVKQRINGTPRAAIQTALSNPHSYLQCECCVETHDKIQDSQPDISILYKLHLECGRLINLYDWLQAFITVIDPSLTDTKKKKSKEKEKQEEQLQARFIRGVAELQYLGFIKSTRRKTDHVARLTWGGC